MTILTCLFFNSFQNMWSVVIFKNDNSVETVPSFWMKKDKCAWPKKNSTMFIKRRILPNKFYFEYLDARKIGKDYGKNSKY